MPPVFSGDAMPWYWPEFENPQSARTARVNAVGVSALFSVSLFESTLTRFGLNSTGQIWFPVAMAIFFAVIGFGIYRMSRAAAIAGVTCWSLWLALHIPRQISKL